MRMFILALTEILHMASESRYFEIFHILSEVWQILNQLNTSITPLYFASKKGKISAFEWVIINISTVDGFSRLHTFCELGHIQVVRYFTTQPKPLQSSLYIACVIALREDKVHVLLLSMLKMRYHH